MAEPTETAPGVPRAVVHKKILDVAEREPGASYADIADQVAGATADLVENVLSEYGDPAEEADGSTDQSAADGAQSDGEASDDEPADAATTPPAGEDASADGDDGSSGSDEAGVTDDDAVESTQREPPGGDGGSDDRTPDEQGSDDGRIDDETDDEANDAAVDGPEDGDRDGTDDGDGLEDDDRSDSPGNDDSRDASGDAATADGASAASGAAATDGAQITAGGGGGGSSAAQATAAGAETAVSAEAGGTEVPDDETASDAAASAVDRRDLSTAQVETLRAIHRRPDATQAEIASELGVVRATVSNRVNDIEGFEWRNRRRFVEQLFGEPAGDADELVGPRAGRRRTGPPGTDGDAPGPDDARGKESVAEGTGDADGDRPDDGRIADLSARLATVEQSLSDDGQTAAGGETTDAGSDDGAVTAVADGAGHQASEDPELLCKGVRTLVAADRLDDDESIELIRRLL